MKKLMKSLLAVMLIVMMAVSFTSCGVPSDPAKAEKNLKENEYVIDKVGAKTAVTAYVGVVSGLSSVGKVGEVILATNAEDVVLIVYSEDAEILKKLSEDLEALFEKVCPDKKDVDLEQGKSGKCVWVGTAGGVKAAK